MSEWDQHPWLHVYGVCCVRRLARASAVCVGLAARVLAQLRCVTLAPSTAGLFCTEDDQQICGCGWIMSRVANCA